MTFLATNFEAFIEGSFTKPPMACAARRAVNIHDPIIVMKETVGKQNCPITGVALIKQLAPIGDVHRQCRISLARIC